MSAEPGLGALLEAMPDPATVDNYWRRICREMVTRAAAAEYERGLRDGYVLCGADLKAWQHGIVRDLQLEVRRWHLCCPACRRGGHRDKCPDCESRTRDTFGEPMNGEAV